MINRLRTAIRGAFLAGFLVLGPLAATIWILRTIAIWADAFFLGLLPATWHPRVWLGLEFPGLGLLTSLLLVFCVGLITRVYVARWVIGLGEWVMRHIPIARGIYHGMKQITQFLLGDSAGSFRRVVLVPFGARDTKSYGFVVGELLLPDPQHQSGRGLPADRHAAESGLIPHLRVFVPTSPNPTSGFLLVLPAHDTLPTTLTVEQATKMIVSGGFV